MQKRLGDRRVGERRKFPSSVFKSIENMGIPTFPGNKLPPIALYKRNDGTITTDTRKLIGKRGTGRNERRGPEERRLVQRRKGKEQIQTIDGKRFVIVPGKITLKGPQPEFVRVINSQTKKGKSTTIKQTFMDRRIAQRRGTGRIGRATDLKNIK